MQWLTVESDMPQQINLHPLDALACTSLALTFHLFLLPFTHKNKCHTTDQQSKTDRRMGPLKVI